MSILIKGMEMPKTCGKCDFYETYRDMVTGEVIFECKRKATVVEHPFTQRDKNCPLTELPPHGRLIDIKSVEEGKFVTVGNDYQGWWNGALESVIDNAPTVIEAEGET